MKIKQILLTSALCLSAFIYQGCQTVPAEPEPSEPEPQQQSMQQDTGKSVGTITTDLVDVNKSVDKFATVGEQFTYIYEVSPKTKIKDVVLTDMIPEGLTYISSSPTGELTGDEIVWTWPELDAGNDQVVRMTVRADQVGTFRNCATITAIPVACTLVTVGEAKLMVAKSVDRREFKVGETPNYTITVRNTGNALAKNVMLVDDVPQGLIVPSDLSARVTGATGTVRVQGRQVTVPVGDIAPGASRTVTFPLNTSTSGEFINTVMTTADNVLEDEDDQSEVPIMVRVPGLEVEKSGTREQFAGKRAEYDIVVRNSGETTLRNVIVTDTLPSEYRLVDADGGNFDEATSTITWNIPSLPSGDEVSYEIEVINLIGGTFTNTVVAEAPEDNLVDRANAPTTWEGYPALLIEVIDTEDPLLVDDTTSYVIRVTNQGTAPDYNIRIRAEFPVQLAPVSASGAARGTVSGNMVDFAQIPVLEPKQTVEYTIRARAAELGDGRVFFRLDSELLQQPVTEEESTQVY